MHERKLKLGLTKEPVDPPIDLKAIFDRVKRKTKAKEQEDKEK